MGFGLCFLVEVGVALRGRCSASRLKALKQTMSSSRSLSQLSAVLGRRWDMRRRILNPGRDNIFKESRAVGKRDVEQVNARKGRVLQGRI
jgi:hypothetical protein